MNCIKWGLIVCGMSVALSACGGGGGSGSPAPAQKTQKTVMIEAYGDSTMAGYTYPNWPDLTASISVDNQPAVLQQLLGVPVTNKGVSGSNTTDLLSGTNGVALPWAQQMAQSSATIVVINDGINDAIYRPEPVDVYRDHLTQLVQIARASGKIVVFEQPNPVNDNGQPNPLLDPYVQTMTQVAQTLAVPIAMNYAYDLGLPDWPDMLSDGTHPKGDLYRLEAGQLASVVRPLL